jgi:hypothetical protein
MSPNEGFSGAYPSRKWAVKWSPTFARYVRSGGEHEYGIGHRVRCRERGAACRRFGGFSVAPIMRRLAGVSSLYGYLVVAVAVATNPVPRSIARRRS